MRRTLTALFVLAAIAPIEPVTAAPPPPPPPPPQELPEEFEGYRTVYIWGGYNEQRRRAIPAARDRLLEQLRTAIDANRFAEDLQIIMQHVRIEGRGDWYEGNTSAVVETVCLVPDGTAEEACYLRARMVGPYVGDNQSFNAESFDLETAVRALQAQGISPDDLIRRRGTYEMDFGLPKPDDFVESNLRYAVFDEMSCEPLRAAMDDLISKTNTFLPQPRDVPYPHTGFVSLILARPEVGNHIKVYHLWGYNRLPVMVGSNAFIDELLPCFEAAKTLSEWRDEMVE